MDSTRFIIIFCIIFATVAISSCQNSHSSSNKDHHSLSCSENGCVCINYNCGCCEKINWRTFGIDGTVCTNMTYLPTDYGLSLTLTYNNYTLYNETVSARNPPAVCLGIPELEDISAEICLKLYDLSFDKKHCHGCLEIRVEVYHILHKSVDIGCFNLPMDYSTSIDSVKMMNIFGSNDIIDGVEDKKNILPSVKMI